MNLADRLQKGSRSCQIVPAGSIIFVHGPKNLPLLLRSFAAHNQRDLSFCLGDMKSRTLVLGSLVIINGAGLGRKRESF